MEHPSATLTPFWFSADDLSYRLKQHPDRDCYARVRFFPLLFVLIWGTLLSIKIIQNSHVWTPLEKEREGWGRVRKAYTCTQSYSSTHIYRKSYKSQGSSKHEPIAYVVSLYCLENKNINMIHLLPVPSGSSFFQAFLQGSNRLVSGVPTYSNLWMVPPPPPLWCSNKLFHQHITYKYITILRIQFA